MTRVRALFREVWSFASQSKSLFSLGIAVFALHCLRIHVLDTSYLSQRGNRQADLFGVGCLENFLRDSMPLVYDSASTKPNKKLSQDAGKTVQTLRKPTSDAFGFEALFVTHWRGGASHRERQAVRKADLLQRLSELGITSFWIEDFDAEDLDCEKINCFYPPHSRRQGQCLNRVMGLGELSLAVKHAAAYYFLLNQGLESAVVVEDDVIFTDQFRGINAYIDQAPFGWGLLVSGGPCIPQEGFQPVNNSHLLFHTETFNHRHVMRCSHGYAISRIGALEYFATVLGGQCVDACEDGAIRRHGMFDRSDDILSRMDERKLTMYYMEPSPMVQQLATSTSERAHMLIGAYDHCVAEKGFLTAIPAFPCTDPFDLKYISF